MNIVGKIKEKVENLRFSYDKSTAFSNGVVEVL
jgi:hypothetical protein